ncbi:hypothetical protein TNCT_315231 [Trichonephila clavata]|uniref:Uncharacterized protein n=1 Tax=Trichonephila clavata TaxID=2740835 RepID=A0A8X6FV16_TRICU|nr:hypothetical protein TNCT_315231 [Trichonephila clavata]
MSLSAFSTRTFHRVFEQFALHQGNTTQQMGKRLASHVLHLVQAVNFLKPHENLTDLKWQKVKRVTAVWSFLFPSNFTAMPGISQPYHMCAGIKNILEGC